MKQGIKAQLAPSKDLENEMATHPSIFSWRIPMDRGAWGLQSMGLQRVGHYLVTKQQQLS